MRVDICIRIMRSDGWWWKSLSISWLLRAAAAKSPSHLVDMFAERTTLQWRIPNRCSFDRRESGRWWPLFLVMSIFLLSDFWRMLRVSYLRISTPTYPMEFRMDFFGNTFMLVPEFHRYGMDFSPLGLRDKLLSKWHIISRQVNISSNKTKIPRFLQWFVSRS